MAKEVPDRSRGSETEKITINLGPVDLGQIDLLVEEGFYSNRTDLIRTAIRNQLSIHAPAVKETVTRRELVLGLQHFSKQDALPQVDVIRARVGFGKSDLSRISHR
ncbi:Arc/MetJ-type ribon-helix-helix transcriptional regulator [Paraburkholderia atlantica]